MTYADPKWYSEHRDLVATVEAIGELTQPAVIAQLRRGADAQSVSTAVGLVLSRRRAAGRLIDAEKLLLDDEALQQASSTTVAQHKARRFAACGASEVIDLCCGIGGDAMGLAPHVQLSLVDQSASRVAMARFNVEQVSGRWCDAVAADVRRLNLRDRVFHLDPSRRSGQRRLHDYADYQPGPEFIEQLLLRNADGAIKLGPGVEAGVLPAGEVEWISDCGVLVQAVLWTGRFAMAARRATVLPAGATLAGEASEAGIGRVCRYLLAVDASVERAGLMGELSRELDALSIHPKLGLLSTDRLVDSAFVTVFEHHATMPWRVGEVRRWLEAHGAGVVEVKTRGGAVEPDRVQRELRGRGEGRFTVFVLRYDQRLVAHITERVDRLEGA